MWIRVKTVGHGQSYNTARARKLTSVAIGDCTVAWPCAHSNIFARRLDLDLSILAVSGAISWVITEQVLRAQFSRDRCERLRQHCERVGPLHLATRSIGQLAQITIGCEVCLIEDRFDLIVSRFPSARAASPIDGRRRTA